ncbi:MAG: hypothetical protein ACTHN5_21275 [Phycisphaerae bacterium]
MKRPALLILLLLAAFPVSAPAATPLHPQLPQDTLAFLELDPTVARAPDQSALLDLGVQAMESMGILSKKASEVGDMLTLIAMAGTHHSCVALLDADLSATPQNDLECHAVQVAWVIDTAGRPNEMVDRLTRMLSHLSTRATARQSVRKTPESHREYVHFRDTTWPDWLSLEWTQQANTFILTIGNGAMEHYLADRPVGGAPWLPFVDEADKAAAVNHCVGDVESRIFVNTQLFRERFPEPMRRTILGQLFSTLDLNATQSSLFSARIRDREISLDNATLANGSTTDTAWTVPVTPALQKLIPPEATAYLALKLDWPALFTRTLTLLDAIVPDNKMNLSQMLAKEEAHRNVNIERDILPYLEPIVLIHDAPPHPLRLPLMVTVVGAAQRDHAADVKTSLNTLLGVADKLLGQRSAAHAPAANPDLPDLTHLRIRADKDDVTYLQFGLVGPAWTWGGRSQNLFVFSWSPAAVRYNLSFVSPAGPDAFKSAP